MVKWESCKLTEPRDICIFETPVGSPVSLFEKRVNGGLEALPATISACNIWSLVSGLKPMAIYEFDVKLLEIADTQMSTSAS